MQQKRQPKIVGTRRCRYTQGDLQRKEKAGSRCEGQVLGVKNRPAGKTTNVGRTL